MAFWNRSLGKRGERIAARFLRKAGCRILARNFTAGGAEIDLVAREKKTGRIVFAEVKTRTDESVALGEQAVGRAKQRHIVRAAQLFLRRKGLPDESPVRFDVLAVTFDGDGRPEVRHTPAAFRP